MRLWTISPKYLDTNGLLALWRESLLAKKVLEGGTKGYKNHPQLNRFKAQTNPVDAINYYLLHIWLEAQTRGYKFDNSKFIKIEIKSQISVTSGQIKYEWKHLQNKLNKRAKERYLKNLEDNIPSLHPLFIEQDGEIESWEQTLL